MRKAWYDDDEAREKVYSVLGIPPLLYGSKYVDTSTRTTMTLNIPAYRGLIAGFTLIGTSLLAMIYRRSVTFELGYQPKDRPLTPRVGRRRKDNVRR